MRFNELAPPHVPCRPLDGHGNHTVSIAVPLRLPIYGLIGLEPRPPAAERAENPAHEHLAGLGDDDALMLLQRAPDGLDVGLVEGEGLLGSVGVGLVAGLDEAEEVHAVAGATLSDLCLQAQEEGRRAIGAELTQEGLDLTVIKCGEVAEEGHAFQHMGQTA